jgi:ribosomal protein S18 acetylase RimI-like enzyme
MSGIAIRPATPGEFPAILGLWRDAAAFATPTDDIDGLRALNASDPQALIVATGEGNEIVGTIIVGWDGWRGNIYRLVVAPGHRRRGLGRRLVQAACDALAARGVRRIGAVVDAGDEQAMAFWNAASALGFHDQDQARFAWRAER